MDKVLWEGFLFYKREKDFFVGVFVFLNGGFIWKDIRKEIILR